MHLYHKVPANLQGDSLLPLNELKQENETLYQFHVKKYENREDALKRRVVPLNCLWNDVLHLTPIHPTKIKNTLIAQGLQVASLGHYFKFDISWLGLNAVNSTYFWSKSQHFGDWSFKDSDYFKFDAVRLTEFLEVPKETEQYYKQQISIGCVPLLYFRTPHVLFKGRIQIDENTEVIEC